MFDSLWKSETDIIVPIFGGMWDGASALCKSLKPGTVMRLSDSRYEIEWRNGAPRLIHIV